MLKGFHFLKQKKQPQYFLSLVIFACLVRLISDLAANLDLIDGVCFIYGWACFVDGVYKILPKKLRWVSVCNPWCKYIYMVNIWNLNALVGFFPEYFFGSTGLILSERVSSVFFLSLSYFFFSITFLKNSVFRLIGFFLLVNAPFSYYLMTMPKPEPVQLFFLFLFLFFSKKKNFALGKKPWFFLGLSIGTRFRYFRFPSYCCFFNL